MSQQHPQFQPAGPVQNGPAPKRKHPVRNVFLIIGGAIVGLIVLVGVIGAAAGGGGEKGGKAAEAGATLPNVVTKTSAPAAAAPSKTAVPKATPPAASKPAQQPAAVACADQDDRNAPCNVKAGQPFQLGKHTVLAGWKVVDAGYGLSMTGKAKNTGDSASAMIVDVKFLKGDEVLAKVMCTTDELEPGQTAKMDCLGTDAFTRKYTSITVEATF